MRVPWTPEPVPVLHRRYPAAVAELIDHLDVAQGRRPAPSGDPAHVFDTRRGLRLIISRDRLPDGRVGVHVSASWYRTLTANAKLESLHAEISASWRAISGSTRPLEFIGISGGAVPHFFVEQTN
jgi:hypothetical protein